MTDQEIAIASKLIAGIQRLSDLYDESGRSADSGFTVRVLSKDTDYTVKLSRRSVAQMLTAEMDFAKERLVAAMTSI